MLAVPVTARVRPPRLRTRRNASSMTPDQLAAYRSALADMQALRPTDDRSYAFHAGHHGLPLPIQCQHGTALFLPWHRAYLYFFERELRDREAERAREEGREPREIAQPFWDWTVPATAPEDAIPAAYREERDAAGHANPMHHGTVSPAAMEQQHEMQRPLDLPAETFRQPGLPGTERPTKERIDGIVAERDFDTFYRRLEDWHGRVHVWTGGEGHMRHVPLAAFDPIFWAHHCMIDRLWRIWQLEHPPPPFTDAFLGTALAPFPMTVAQTLSVTALGYDYATTAVDIPGEGSPGG
jgi:tyrosinase